MSDRASGMRLPGLGALIVVAALSAACAEAVRPVLGGLKIGAAAGGPFMMPSLLNEELPFEYPEDAWVRGVGGETLLRIHINASGWVDTVAVERSSGDAALDSASVAGARLLHYRPARKGDEAVPVWAYLPVRYPMPEAAVDGGPEPRR